jgi:diguanylate cyclase
MDFWRFARGGIDPATLISGSYEPRLIFASFLVASLAGYTALDVIERVRERRGARARIAWIGVGSSCMGLGIWAMHFIGMLALALPVPVSYGLSATVASVLPAVLASGVSIWILSAPLTRPRLYGGGAVLALGIGTMHYMGMEAMRAPLRMRYDPGLFIASLLVAFIFATVAFWSEARLMGHLEKRRVPLHLVGGLILGAAVCGMHYTAMRASLFQSAPSMGTAPSTVSPFGLSVAVVVVTTAILAVAIAGAWFDRRLQHAHHTIERLEGLLPICAWCRKIHDEHGSWQTIEAYVVTHSRASVTHGICPSCEENLFRQAGAKTRHSGAS